MVTLIATPGAANANTYLTEAEATAYFAARLPLSPAWEDADDPTATLAMATRAIDVMFRGLRTLMSGDPPHYIVRRAWTGTPASTTQALAWPRLGMYDQNGNAILSTVIPQGLKDATAELAGQLLKGDRTLDNDVIVQGLTSVRAGSVSLSFKDSFLAQVIPDAVLHLLVPGWVSDELWEPAMPALFDVISE